MEDFIKLEKLYQFMKENYVMRARVREMELELHPVAFNKDIEPIPETKEEVEDYEKFLYPGKQEIEKAGL